VLCRVIKRGPSPGPLQFTLGSEKLKWVPDSGTLIRMGIKDISAQSEYENSIPYGRPLFVKMLEDGQLEGKCESILDRLLLGATQKEIVGSQMIESRLSVLATRVQMGSTRIDMVSKLVAKGYANLTGVTANFATFRLHA
jgi:hypothetical protein